MVILRKQDVSTSIWQGGSSSQYFIYPEDAQLALRNFDYRISAATVEAPESQFSDFTGYLRCLTLMQGSILLQHEGQEAFELPSHKVYFFNGSWPTKAVGTCSDFNIIYKSDFLCFAETLSFATKQLIGKSLLSGVYSHSAFELLVGETEYTLEEQSLCLFSEEELRQETSIRIKASHSPCVFFRILPKSNRFP